MGKKYSKGAIERMAPKVSKAPRSNVSKRHGSPADTRKAGGPPTVATAKAKATPARVAGEGRNANAARRNAAISDALDKVKSSYKKKR